MKAVVYTHATFSASRYFHDVVLIDDVCHRRFYASGTCPPWLIQRGSGVWLNCGLVRLTQHKVAADVYRSSYLPSGRVYCEGARMCSC